MSETSQTPDTTQLTAYQAYQKNIRQAETLQEEVMRGAREGENVYQLLLKTAQAVSLMTGSTVFADQIETAIKALYGEAMGIPAALEIELSQTEERLERIRQAEAACAELEYKQPMLNAIRAHEHRIAELKERMNTGG
ncbi:MAG: hypothetical protein IKP40_01015 [Clostridia bacterium]|nr:hypothetical protein [Clostridia bacterium]